VEVQEKVGGRYKLLDELGSGGMAVVWRARDEVLNRPVAVKLLAGRYADDPQWRSRIRDEARAAAKLSPHPHIAQVYDFGEEDENGACLPYVVMELVSGRTLQERVADGPLPPRTVFRICGEVASALEAAHAGGLVHRDIKPANVIVTPAGAKVVDFGIAAVAGPGKPEDVVLGTPAYLAPERLIGDSVEPATDVYALGVLLYRLLANESPWTVESTTQMLNAHVYIEPAPLPQLPGVPAAVTDLVQRCLRKDPAQRPSAAEAAAVLAGAAEMEVRAQPAPQAPVQRVAEAKRPHQRRTVLALIGVVVVLAGGLLWTLLPASKPADRPSQAAPATTSRHRGHDRRRGRRHRARGGRHSGRDGADHRAGGRDRRSRHGHRSRRLRTGNAARHPFARVVGARGRKPDAVVVGRNDRGLLLRRKGPSDLVDR
jgi:eukaryotic-like serine/threonine-protein kinase